MEPCTDAKAGNKWTDRELNWLLQTGKRIWGIREGRESAGKLM